MKTKYYDKEMYARNESIKGALVVLLSFILGFASGCMAINKELAKQNNEKQDYIYTLEQQVEEQQVTIRDQYIELDSLRETVYMYNIYGKQVLQMISCFIGGLFIGVLIGIGIMCILQVARDDEE